MIVRYVSGLKELQAKSVMKDTPERVIEAAVSGNFTTVFKSSLKLTTPLLPRHAPEEHTSRKETERLASVR